MEKQILEYTIVCDESSRGLSAKVNVLISKGWQPYGSMVKSEVVSISFKEGYIYQPMVRYERYA